MVNSASLSLGEAVRQFLSHLAAEEGKASQQEIYRFVRWYGWERSCTELKAAEVASYAEHLSSSDAVYLRKLELVRAFLAYASKAGWTRGNLAPHLKIRKGGGTAAGLSRRVLSQTTALTREGYAQLEAELAALKSQRGQAIEEIQRAAADKDFRENAPLEAAREQRGHLEGRIRELEEALKSATIIDEKAAVKLKADIGDSVVARDLASGEERHYMLVSPREVDPVRGKISSVSPIGKAIIGHGQGDIIEVVAPAGKVRYQIMELKR